jgi:hypothetical protein
VRRETNTRTFIHHPFLKPPLTPSIEEGEKKKTEQRRKIG